MPRARAAGTLIGAVTVGVGLSLAACGARTELGASWQDGGSDSGGLDSGADADGGMGVVMYGPAPWDGATPVDSGADADGGMIAMYGLPPPPPQDAGKE